MSEHSYPDRDDLEPATVDEEEQEDVPEHDGESYEIAEFVDDALASGEWNEYLKSQYVYSFKQGGRPISDLTASGIFHIGLEHGLSIESCEFEKMTDGVLCTAVAIKVETEQRHTGIAYQSYKIGNKVDQFCWQKAASKAQRNAMRALIPATMRIAAVGKLLTLTEAEAKALTQGDAGALPAPTPEPKEDTPQQKAMKRMFAVFRDYKESLEALGITDEIFWDGVREHYDVESRNDMTIDQLNNVVSSLEYVSEESGVAYASWIQDLAPEPETNENENSDDAIPF